MRHHWRVRSVLDEFDISLDGARADDEARKQSRAGVEHLLRGLDDHRIRPVLLEVYAALRGEPVHAFERMREQWALRDEIAVRVDDAELLEADALGGDARELPPDMLPESDTTLETG